MYRFVKVTLGTGEEIYKIQRKCKHFNIWKTYQDVYDGNYSSHDGWTFFLKYGDQFVTLELAKNALESIEKRRKRRKIASVEVVDE